MSLKFCLYVNAETLQIIADEANPYFLRELYLDGCDKVNDSALANLVSKGKKEHERPEFAQFFSLQGNIYLHDFSSIAVNQEEMHQIVTDISIGGARGLEVLSLAECRNVFDAGISYLSNLKYLKKLTLLGCANVKDDGVRDLAKNQKYLEDIDLGGTLVTVDALRDLVTFCLNIKKVNISGCKKLNASDDNILRQNKINFEGGEDVFRFYLIPEQYSDLPRITNSVLKTRSTLSLHKVYKYLIKKLQTDHVIEELNDDQQADSFVEILCNGIILNPYIQLKVAKEKYWHFQDQLLTLNYRRKENLNDQEIVSIQGREYQPKKPPLWVPDHLALSCLRCEREFTLFRRIHHCRNCGRCFCDSCSNNWRPIEHFGYFSPVRVCTLCKNELQGVGSKLQQ